MVLRTAKRKAGSRNRGSHERRPGIRSVDDGSKTPTKSAAALLSVFGMTDVGRMRETNEDAFLVGDARVTRRNAPLTSRVACPMSAPSILVAVADGMGGENAGEVASELALRASHEELARALPEREAPSALRAAFRKANAAVLAAADAPDREGMGSTLVALLFEAGQAYIANVGDSRAYLLRGGDLIPLTRDQTYLQYLIDQGELSSEQIATFPYKNLLIQAIGASEALDVPIQRLSLRRDDLLLLCSDGLTREIEVDQARAIVQASTPLEEMCHRLVAAANDQGGHDNVTVVLARATGDLPPPQPGEPLEVHQDRAQLTRRG
jgi:serine/threonine protein phosphatase PrpC